MPKVTYIGTDDDTDSSFCEVFGERYERNVPRDLDSVHPRLHGNPTFVIEGDEPATEAEADGPGSRVEALRAQLDARGIKYHHKAGAEKLNAQLTAAIDAEDD